jgi:hypothetical protein
MYMSCIVSFNGREQPVADASADTKDAPQESGGAADPKRTREQSSIGFPYLDLDDAISVAAALLGNGGVPCEPDQLAAALKHPPTSGTFRMKIATARMFGLIETIQGKYHLTDLGFAITDGSRQKAARADAFLNVPLYRKVYEQFRNQQLPPRPVALERTFVGFGVAQKQADRARVAFDKSAQQAGYFDQGGRDRLIRPPVGSATSSNGGTPIDAPQSDISPPPPPGKSGGGGGDYHPFILGLLDTLPASGTLWTVEGRAAWLEAAASAFKLIYKGEGKITIGVADQKQSGSHQ